MNFRRAKRPISRNSRRVLALAALLASPALLASDAAEAPDSFTIKSRGEPTPDPAIANEIASYARLAVQAADQDKWPLAEHFLELLANLPAPATEKKTAFSEIGARYEKQRLFSKAIAIYEKMLELYPADTETPELIFKVGLLYREAGAYQRAITRFYSVLNSALKVNGRGFDAYRNLTQRAQAEIADTYLRAGDHAQAAKFYTLLARLELAPTEKARVRFKLTHCQYLRGDFNGSVASAQAFLADFPDDPSAPECRYLLASALRSLRRPKEAFDVVLALLRDEQARKEKAPDKWSFWQKKTGNEFANDFYQQGDFTSALTIYQTLARLSEEPEWQWPVVYQMGLCFERLRLAGRAADAYKFIIDESKKPAHTAKPLPGSTADLVQMARWRGEQLAWQQTAGTQLSHLLGEPLAPAPAADAPKAHP